MVGSFVKCSALTVAAKKVAEKNPFIVILSEAKNLSRFETKD